MFQSYYAFKVVGSVLVVASGLMVGNKMKTELRMRKELLTEYKLGLDFLKSRIVLDELALCECMEECEKRFCSKYPDFNVFSIFKNNLIGGTQSVEELWLDSIKYVAQKGVLHDAEIDLLSSLSVILGKTDVTHHSEHIKDVIEKLDALVSEADAKLKKDGNLYLKLSAASAAVLVLLLW